MEFIDKTQTSNIKHAYQLLDGFLKRCSQGVNWPSDLYDAMKSDKNPSVPNAKTTTYNDLRQILLTENQHRCCYCMREIKEFDTTLEHIIPNKVADQTKYDEYKQYYSQSDWQKMIFAKDFLKSPKWPYRSYPYTIAYENLIPSCNGKFARINTPLNSHSGDSRVSKSCNNKRGNDFVIPFVINNQMVSEFEYKKDGRIVWTVNKAITGQKRIDLLKERKETIDRLGLNCDELVAIRRIWFFLANNGLDLQKDKDRTIFFLSEDDKLTQQEKDMLTNFWSENYWSLLEEYKYFNDVNKFG